MRRNLAADEPQTTVGANDLPIHALNRASHRDKEAIPGANRPAGLDEVTEQVRSSESKWSRIRVPLSSIQVNDDHIIASGRDFRLNRPGLTSLCGDIDAPANHVSTLPSGLRKEVLEFGLRKAGQRGSGLSDENSSMLVRNGEFRGFDRVDLHSLGGAEVISAVQDGLGQGADGFRVENFNLHDESFALDLVSHRMAAEVRAGDVLQGGIHLEHSFVGETATTLVAFVLRLVCRNGLTHRECVGSRKTRRTRRLSSDQENAAELQHAQIKGLAEETCRRLDGKLQAISNLRDDRFHEVADVDRTFEQFLRRGRMYSQNLMQLLQRAWAEELGGNGELTHFGVLNALTWLATHSRAINHRQRIALSNLAGIFANQRVHICPACFSVVSGSGERAPTSV